MQRNSKEIKQRWIWVDISALQQVTSDHSSKESSLGLLTTLTYNLKK
jgi:hypothetical protein